MDALGCEASSPRGRDDSDIMVMTYKKIAPVIQLASISSYQFGIRFFELVIYLTNET